jgi:hypothetical protein
MNDHCAFEAVRHAARRLSPAADGLAPMLDLIGDARIVALTALERWSWTKCSGWRSTRSRATWDIDRYQESGIRYQHGRSTPIR